MTITLDPMTIRFCASLAREAAAGIPRARSHHDVAAATLVVLAEQMEALLKREERKQ